MHSSAPGYPRGASAPRRSRHSRRSTRTHSGPSQTKRPPCLAVALALGRYRARRTSRSSRRGRREAGVGRSEYDEEKQKSRRRRRRRRWRRRVRWMSDGTGLGRFGIGLGWRPELAQVIASDERLFVEVIAENVDPQRLPPRLENVVSQGRRVIPHGIRLSLGGGQRPDPRRLDHLAAVAAAVNAPLVSEHIAFARAHGIEAGHVLPVPRTNEALEIISENVAAAQQRLQVPLALEHVAALLEWPDPAMARRSLRLYTRLSVCATAGSASGGISPAPKWHAPAPGSPLRRPTPLARARPPRHPGSIAAASESFPTWARLGAGFWFGLQAEATTKCSAFKRSGSWRSPPRDTCNGTPARSGPGGVLGSCFGLAEAEVPAGSALGARPVAAIKPQ